jgi:hypothetical protein
VTSLALRSSSPLVAQAEAPQIPDRYELKYLISPAQVEAVRRAIAPYCMLDTYAERAPGHAYGVQSLYLDTPNRDLFRLARERRARRWKARIRRYEGASDVFLEIKEKDHTLVKKQRASIPHERWAERIQCTPGAGITAAEHRFRERVQHHGLVPTLMVHYLREAWSSTIDSYARVTFDRRIACQPWREWTLDADPRGYLALDGRRAMMGIPEGVVLELKCLTAVPRWFANVAESAGLLRVSFSKYCKGIERHFARDTLLGVLNQT